MLRRKIPYERRGGPGPIPDGANHSSQRGWTIMTETENTTFAQDGIVAPAVARDFVKKAAEAAKNRAAALHANVEKATTNVEQTLANTVGEVAKLTRQAQQAA